MSNQESVAPPCVDVTLIYSLWFRSSSPPARRPPLANTLPARLHIFGRKLLAGVESNFQSVSLSPSLRRNPARQEEGRREDGIVWSSTSSSAAAVIFAHTMAALARGGQRRRTSEEKKGIRFRIPKFFPNRAEPGQERRSERGKQSDLFGARNALRLSTAECVVSALLKRIWESCSPRPPTHSVLHVNTMEGSPLTF